jgi:hypothetical protein
MSSPLEAMGYCGLLVAAILIVNGLPVFHLASKLSKATGMQTEPVFSRAT